MRRFLKLRGYKMKHVMNLTDVDDRIIANAAAAGVSIRDYTEKYAQAFFDDCKTLSIEAPEHWIRATDHIDDMVKLIQRLQEKSYTYPSEGSIYYRIAKFPALRQALEYRCDRHSGWRARGRRSLRKRERARLCACGKRQSPANIFGRHRSVRAGPAGILNAPRWQ